MSAKKTDFLNMPQKVILSTAAAVQELRVWLSKQSFRLETEPQNHAGGLFSYITDDENARENVAGYLEEIEEELKDKLTEKELFELLCQLEDLAQQIWREMKLWNVFSHSGTNWYYFHDMMGDDMVIILMDLDTIDELEDEGE